MEPTDVLQRLASLADDVPAAIAVLEKQRAEIDLTIRRLRRYQHVFGAGAPKPGQLVEKKSPRAPRAPAQLAVRVAEVTKGLGERFTVLEVHRALDGSISEPRVYEALRWLKDQHYIDDAGSQKSPKGRTRKMYRIMPDGEHILAELRTKVRS